MTTTATSRTAQLQARWNAALIGTYGTPPVALVSGQGCYVTDADGHRYLDLIAGIAVSSLGHAHPALVAAVSEQVATIAHTSNLVMNPKAVELAERLAALSQLPGARVFLCNDGTTAIEAAIKALLRHAPASRRRFVAAERSFHGRSLGALALTGKAAIREPFAPFGFDVQFVPYGDAEALQAAVDESTAGVVLEPTLGEAGVIPPPDGYLTAARAVCDHVGAALVIDEVQGGIARTGRWFAHQHEGITPDLVTVAKGLGGGLPVGACIAGERFATALGKGDHGSTFGGNPVAAAAALAVIDTIERDGVLDHVAKLGESWKRDLAAVRHDALRGARGRGLWLALELADDIAPAVEAGARAAGFLVNAVAPDTIRLAPPLILSSDEAASFTAELPAILDAAVRLSK